jgi:glycosyltransferase involved in cell wall biosynthesis
MAKSVAIVSCAWPPQGGGIGNNAHYHAKNLQQLGYRVAVFTPLYRHTAKDKSDLAVNYLPVFLPLGKAGFLFSIFKKLSGFDIVHLYYPFFGTDLLVLLYKIFHHRQKLILHYQMDAVGNGWKKLFFRIYIILFFGLLVRVSDKIIVLSFDHAQNSHLKKWLKIFPEKFVEIPNGVETDLFKPAPPDIRLLEKYGINPNEPVILFVGGLDRQHYFKGVDVLLKTFKKINLQFVKSKLLIIGDGDLKNDYERQAEILGLSEKVIFTGWVDNADLPDYYRLAKIFILPSTARTESFGIVIAEAQACGVPAVVSSWPGSRQTLVDGGTGFLVQPGSVEELSQKIVLLLSNEEMWNDFSRQAALVAQSRYAWAEIIKKICQIYER